MFKSILAALIVAAASAVAEHQVEFPAVFGNAEVKSCDDNLIVHGWCDSYILPELECGILTDFDEYGCKCEGKAASCPTECINGNAPLVKTHYGIRCKHIPVDSPNYILKESHKLKRCEGNLLVSNWCDDFINPHLECGVYPEDDQYLCKCSGKNANCPDECIGGGDPLVRTAHSVLCTGIPIDSPNYILREE
eukprot:CAMPEP_0119013760 /NCGR_PEP_ID=MMETSP1176-20130426/8921_1 /TAXON_ID=265551 /ORGANISM="Synedropsis recta cf, Strain CCMP1620" /LENGTH=192 /DNA_ID=CAMNT_0006966877 /DNA_START=17 /DNA_END=595 /DNA_ORIENTATION=+